MRAQQAGFDFDTFSAFGWTATPVEDADAWARRDAEKARQDKERRERETRERFQREQREREEQARRARSRSGAYESPWSILGVEPGASKATIRAAWITLCKRFHPDHGGSLADMQRVNKAWNELKGQMR